MSKQGRIRTQELRKSQQEAAVRQARRRRIVTGVGVLVILGLLAAIVLAVMNAIGDDDGPPAATGKVVVPDNGDASGAVPVGEPDAPVTVEIYYDYMCPACGAFEAANGGELERLLEEGAVRVELRPISFLDDASSGTEYSTRAANAFATVADGAPDSIWDFHGALYEQQPAEGGRGLSNDEIAAIAEDAGVPADVVDRFSDRTFDGWVASVTEKAFDSGIEGTPTIKIDGEVFTGDVYSVGPLTEAIESAAGDQ